MPIGKWGLTWTLAILLVGVTVARRECSLRERGLLPAATDDQSLWATWRARASDGRFDTVVFLGSSRVLAGIDLASFSEVVGRRRVVQLAINGSTPVPVLESLAADGAFRGVAIVGISPPEVFMQSERVWQTPTKWVRRYHARPPSWFERNERLMVAFVQSYLAVRVPFRAQNALVDHRGEVTRQRQVSATRGMRLWFRPGAVVRREHVIADAVLHSPVPSVIARNEIIDRMELAAKAINGRGGKVILLRMPSSGLVRSAERTKYPRRHFWNELAQGDFDGAVHFEDVPRLAGFTCEEGSHLDAVTATIFSRTLASWMVGKKLL